MNNNSKILITGCGGMLGEAVYAELKDKYKVYATDIDLNEPWLNLLDVRSTEDIDKSFKKVKPDIVIHLAALTDMEYCELNPKHAYNVNFIGTYKMVCASIKRNIPFVYISSAGIFDGKKQNYSEIDIPNPLNVYASSKYAGELAAITNPKTIVVRAGWMMGGGPKKDKKFVNKIIKQINSGAKELFIVKDKLGTPTYTYDLARTIRYLLENNLYGLYNGACDGGGSRFDVAKSILKNLKLNEKISIKVVDSKYFHKEYFATRPFSEKLINYKIKSINSSLVNDWRKCLKDYLNKFEWKI
jgi:dTDP-4-dehydrorhamnose reductase